MNTELFNLKILTIKQKLDSIGISNFGKALYVFKVK